MKAKIIRCKYDGAKYEVTGFDLRKAIYNARIIHLNQRRIADPFIEDETINGFKQDAYKLRKYAFNAIHDSEIIQNNLPGFKIFLQKNYFLWKIQKVLVRWQTLTRPGKDNEYYPPYNIIIVLFCGDYRLSRPGINPAWFMPQCGKRGYSLFPSLRQHLFTVRFDTVLSGTIRLSRHLLTPRHSQGKIISRPFSANGCARGTALFLNHEATKIHEEARREEEEKKRRNEETEKVRRGKKTKYNDSNGARSQLAVGSWKKDTKMRFSSGSSTIITSFDASVGLRETIKHLLDLSYWEGVQGARIDSRWLERMEIVISMNYIFGKETCSLFPFFSFLAAKNAKEREDNYFLLLVTDLLSLNIDVPISGITV